ncbi:MAG: hypothetical protein ABH877_03105 [bacterium]
MNNPTYCEGGWPSSRARRLHCERYTECLNHAVAKRWSGFSCEECSAYVEEPAADGTEEMTELGRACARVLLAAFIGPDGKLIVDLDSQPEPAVRQWQAPTRPASDRNICTVPGCGQPVARPGPGRNGYYSLRCYPHAREAQRAARRRATERLRQGEVRDGS